MTRMLSRCAIPAGTLVVTWAIVTSAAELPEAEESAGFVSLFDGTSLTGWQAATEHWAAEDGKLIYKSIKPARGSRDLLDLKLMTTKQYADFLLRFEFRDLRIKGLSNNPSPPTPLPASGARGAGLRIGTKELAGSQRQPTTAAAASPDYFPAAESAGGWRTLKSPEDIRRIAGMDPAKLDALGEWLLASDKRNSAAVVVRRGYVVLEVERGNSAKTDARRVASVSKAVCATVLAIASEQSQHGRTPKKMTFDDPAFDFIPQAYPLSDPRKAKITVKQLLNHTSGITPEATGARNQGPWRHVLGHDGDPLTARLAFDPGTKCGYSTFAFYHASLVCENVTGKPYDQFAIEALFRPIGVERWTFEYFDGGGPDGNTRYGRHPSHSLGLPARDLARIAYCMLRGGRWNDKQVVPRWFVEQTAAPTHDVKEPELRFHRAAQSFSHGWELPARLTDGRGDGIPQDARFKPGSGGQLVAFVPSLDLVVTRQTGSSGSWDYEEYLRLACDAVMKE